MEEESLVVVEEVVVEEESLVVIEEVVEEEPLVVIEKVVMDELLQWRHESRWLRHKTWRYP